MDTLIDLLDTDKWTEVNSADRGEGFVECAINRNAKQVDPNTLAIMIADDAGNCRTVTINNTRENKNPVKNVGRAEIKLDEEGKTVLGIDIDGDCVVAKS
ncbi:uncharacterized protein LOC133188623 [Saccostrea echinata]|uniref:uncharacterized protein LOC133188623 n=1 Tax=Saccostrea echinata TaxID=191078 RepID=UPI002A805FAE|nr:uncharacterized protein LOC133188623 [Saccostrea echinata]